MDFNHAHKMFGLSSCGLAWFHQVWSTCYTCLHYLSTMDHWYSKVFQSPRPIMCWVKRRTSKSTPTLFFIIETLQGIKWEPWSIMYAYLDYETFVQCNTVTLKYYYYVTLRHCLKYFLNFFVIFIYNGSLLLQGISESKTHHVLGQVENIKIHSHLVLYYRQ